MGTRAIAFWTVVAGLLALVGILLSFRTAHLTSANPAAQPAPIPAPTTSSAVPQAIVPAGNGEPTSSSEPAGNSEPTSSSEPAVRNHGPGTLVNRGTGLDLDSTAPDWGGPVASVSEVDVYIDTCCTGAPINAGKLVKVNGRPIAYQTCANAADYAHTLLTLDHNDARPGDRYCVVTSDGRYSEIQINSVAKARGPAGDTQFGRVTVTATTWELAELAGSTTQRS